ncbi:MAG: DUF4886 domain-containing protein [Candidatus Dormibacterales bacterium]
MGVAPAGKRRMSRVVALLAVVALGAGGASAFYVWLHRDDNPGCQSADRSSSCTRILFLGNSYTSVNDLPTVFADLAWSGGHRVETGSQDPGGWTLADHAGAQSTRTLLAAKPWDLVVVQEQSEIPSIEASRLAYMYPAARKLVSLIRAVDAQPLFFVTWAHRAGWPEQGLAGYPTMQASIDSGYLTIAAEQKASLAPVGFAWMTLVHQAPNIGLWQDDGSHPTTSGTYLAACVFYAAVFGQSPVNLHYRSDLSDAAALQVQEVAAATVLDQMPRWDLPVSASPAAF